MADPRSPSPAAPAESSPAALVAVRDRRDEVIALLSEQFARDSLDIDELDRRLTLAQHADTIVALDQLVADLPALPADAAPAASTTALAHRPDEATLAAWPQRSRRLAIFGGFERKGGWTCPRHLRIVAAFGGAELDFREAELAPGVTELHITAVFGGVSLIVPPHLAVECDASAIFGGFEEIHRAPRRTDPDRPVLRITGFACFGGVSIETRLPGESGRQARRRSRREQRALRDAGRAGLPSGSDRGLPSGREE
ncbi:MAG TPA: LiaF domain-containing protein [Kofleriaceae bacterium]|nr:LiaF domain-containing protein [Kofleriaceae bacterium]